jgi:ribosomal protein S27AE
MNSPLRQNFPQNNNPGFAPQQGYNPGYVPQQGDQFPPRNPDFNPFPRAPPARTVSPYEIERMIDSKLDGVVEKLAKAMGESKREDLMAQEAKEMRMMMLELLKANMVSKGTAEPPKVDPMLAKMLEGQAATANMLLTHALTKNKDDDPMNNPIMKMLLQQALTPKNPTSAPPLANTSEELAQRIQLQRLANDLELAQADFKDKQEGRAFTRDLAGQALSKIGEAVAAAYIESQRIQAEAAKEIAARQAMAVSQQVSPDAQSAPTPVGAGNTGTPSLAENAMHKVRGVTTEDGSVKMACPTCGSDMFAKPGDPQVTCGRCGTVYNATVPKTTHVDEVPKPIPKEPEKNREEQKPTVSSDGEKGSAYYDDWASSPEVSETSHEKLATEPESAPESVPAEDTPSEIKNEDPAVVKRRAKVLL